MKHLSYLLLCALALMVVSCASPEEEATRVANELVQAQVALRDGRIETLRSFVEKFDPARFLDRTSARESLDTQLEALQRQYDAKKQLLDSEYELLKEKYSKKPEKLSTFENTYYTIVFNAPAIISEKEGELREACESIILKIIPPEPTSAKISKDLVGIQFEESSRDGYFPGRKWKINDKDVVDINISQCNKLQDSCAYKVQATIRKPSNAVWEAELQVNYTLGNGDEWDFHAISCEVVMPQFTDTLSDSITHTIETTDTEQVLVITNTSNKTLVVGGQTSNGKDGSWHKFSVFIAPKGTARIDYAPHTPTAEYKIDFVELG